MYRRGAVKSLCKEPSVSATVLIPDEVLARISDLDSLLPLFRQGKHHAIPSAQAQTAIDPGPVSP
jgi:hypothetical protein